MTWNLFALSESILHRTQRFLDFDPARGATCGVDLFNLPGQVGHFRLLTGFVLLILNVLYLFTYYLLLSFVLNLFAKFSSFGIDLRFLYVSPLYLPIFVSFEKTVYGYGV